jgi:hypothetical protein
MPPSSHTLPADVVVADHVLSAIIDTLLAIPPIRFVMGLVESRWRPLWAALWLAVIAYLLSRTMNYWALRRARLRLLTETADGRPLGVVDPAPAATMGGNHPGAASTPALPNEPISPSPTIGAGSATRPQIPLGVVAATLIVAALITGALGVAIRSRPNGPVASAPITPTDSVLKPGPPIDARWKSGRMDDDDCIGTFELTRGEGTRARLVAFVLDTSGAVMTRDSAQIASAVPGMFVEFRFRHVDCDEIDDWQIQATTPTRRMR